MIANADLRKTAKQFFVQSPADLAQGYVQWAKKLKTDPGITYGCVLDRHMIPLHPGDLMAVVARPGHGKSSWMAYMAKKTAAEIVKRKAENEVVVYVTWEQSAEEIEAFFQSGDSYSSTDMVWGRVPDGVIEKAAVGRGKLPVWVFGESKRHEGMKRPKMSIEYVYAAIESMQEDYGVKPVLMCLDYVQIMPTNPRQDKTGQVDEAVRQAKELAIRMGLPIIMGVQAGRKVDEYRNAIPTMSDAQWSSSIEQVADKQLALWRPIRSYDPSDRPFVPINDIEYKNEEDLFIVRILKQRFGIGYGAWAIRFKPQTLEVHDYDTFTPPQPPGRTNRR
jgi:replicative DNA helicase